MKFALAGNPNCGKTTLFNTLTGSTAHTGNWPGVTIDKREGVYKKLPERVDIVDLPGIYSLSPYTPEEVVSRQFILEERPDAVINIVDGTNIERNLYLTTQILEIDVPVVVALNMMDLVHKAGDHISVEDLEKTLGVPVVEISALKGQGIDELMQAAYKAAKMPRKGVSVLRETAMAGMLAAVTERMEKKNVLNPLFHAVKLIEGDEIEVKAHPELIPQVDELKSALPQGVFGEYGTDYEGIVADNRYKFITKYCVGAVKRSKREAESKSDRIDKVLTHRIWGIPIFLGVMMLIFHITFSGNFLLLGWFGVTPIESPGVFLQSQLGNLLGWFTDTVRGWLEPAAPWVGGLVCDGLLGGLDVILSFLPQILLLFLFLAVLEDSGYMARIAFIMDRTFRRFGLSGKAFIPLLMCFGCAVPGIMSTRTLENEKERRMTILLSPFISCGAKLPIWAAFAATVFLGKGGELIVLAMYLLGFAVAIIAALILKRTVFKGPASPFIMELPAYRLPQFGNTVKLLWDKLKHFLKRAATIIAGAVVVIWFLQNFSFSFHMVDDAKDSILGILGGGLRYLFVPLGFGMGDEGWMFAVAALTGLIAKEMVIATLGVLSGAGEGVLDLESGELAGTALGALLISALSVPAALAFMAFNLLAVPCMAAVAAARSELGKGKIWGAIGFWLLTAYIVSAVIYWVGTHWWTLFIVAAVAAALIFLPKLIRKNKTGRLLGKIE